MNSVSVDPATGAAKVSATFREAVVAHRGAADPVQAFRQGPSRCRARLVAASGHSLRHADLQGGLPS